MSDGGVGPARVSVVIPTKDRPAFLAQSLRSALSQRDVDVEVIVVDDGSAEGALDTVAGIDDRRVRVVRHGSSRGVSTARNAGAEVATGAWVAFLDDDDLWAPEKLSSQLRALAAAPTCGWSCVGVLIVTRSLRIIGSHRPPAGPDVAAEMLVRQTVPGAGSAVVVARPLFEAVGGFDPAFAMNADWDIAVRLAQASPLAPVDAPLLAYRVHGGSGSLDVAVCDWELAEMESKYAALSQASQVSLDRRHWDRWKANAHLRGGRPWESFRTLRSSGHGGGAPGLLRDAAVSLMPGSLALRDYWRGRTVPRGWRAQAEPWLATYR